MTAARSALRRFGGLRAQSRLPRQHGSIRAKWRSHGSGTEIADTVQKEAGMRVAHKRIAVLAALAVSAPLWGSFEATAADLPTYKPPSRGAPSARVGGGTRSIQFPVRQLVAVLAPDHPGLTTREQPSLYWYVSQPVASRVAITAMGDSSAKPMLELTIGAPASAGVQKIDLALHGVRLQPGVEYRWNVSIDVGPTQRSSSGRIQRVALSPELAKRLEEAPKSAHVAVYAEQGIWYDAIAAIGELIEQSPNDAGLRLQRASLLEQVGLKEAAAGDAPPARGQGAQ
jgi:hypothetical protein